MTSSPAPRPDAPADARAHYQQEGPAPACVNSVKATPPTRAPNKPKTGPHAQAQGARRDTVGQQQGMEDFDQVKIDLGQSRRIFHPNDHIVFIFDFICQTPGRRLS